MKKMFMISTLTCIILHSSMLYASAYDEVNAELESINKGNYTDINMREEFEIVGAHGLAQKGFISDINGEKYIGGFSPLYNSKKYDKQEVAFFSSNILYDYAKTKSGYLAREITYDLEPDIMRRWNLQTNTLIFYDSDFNKLHSEDFGGYVYIEDIGYYGNKYYCMYKEDNYVTENNDGTKEYKRIDTLGNLPYGTKHEVLTKIVESEDMINWEETESIPKSNSNYVIFDNSTVFGSGVRKNIEYEDTLSKKFCAYLGEWFIKKDDNNMYLTNDNVYFLKLNLSDEDKSIISKYDRSYAYEYGNDFIIQISDINRIRLKMSKTEVLDKMSDLEKAPYVEMNGSILSFEEIPANENDRILVPMRFLFEQMGASVDWNPETQTATATLDNITVTFTINNTEADVNSHPITMDVPARLINGKTMVPLRFLSEELGYTVTWDDESRTAVIE